MAMAPAAAAVMAANVVMAEAAPAADVAAEAAVTTAAVAAGSYYARLICTDCLRNLRHLLQRGGRTGCSKHSGPFHSMHLRLEEFVVSVSALR